MSKPAKPLRDGGTTGGKPSEADSYQHPEAKVAMRPEVGTQAQFRKKKGPRTYRYDSSLAPALDWDGGNAKLRDTAADLLRSVRAAKTLDEAKEAARDLDALSKPFLDWAGKAERLSFDVPTLPLFIHERLSTKAILESLRGHSRDKQTTLFDLFNDPRRTIKDQVLRAYEYQDDWSNRMILGDSLVVMNSLLGYEGLGGQVQMIYMDPPYGVSFKSNFQPFVRQKDVSDKDDEDLSREPEMVQAYRDTWELGLHSYLTYMRDRLLLSRELLAGTGSIFVQISDENLHHVRELLDEVFGPENFISVIPFRKKTMPLGAKYLESVCDYLLWYAKDAEHVFFQRQYVEVDVQGDSHWDRVELPNGSRRRMTRDEINNHGLLPPGAVPFQLMSLSPVGVNKTGLFPFRFRGKTYEPRIGSSWFTNPAGMENLASANRIEPYEDGETLRYVLKLSDAPVTQLTHLWADTSAPRDKQYVVQTNTQVVRRCLLMTTRPGDLIFDPTCGSGTTAFVAEEWGRRWIATDVSRVPLALARQRLLTATFSWHELIDAKRGPLGGFVYAHRVDARGRQVGGIVNKIERGTIANNESPQQILRPDRPEQDPAITRVTGPFTFEATIPTPVDWEGDGEEDSGIDPAARSSFVDRMVEVLRRSPILRLAENRTLAFKNVRVPAKTLSLSAEATIENGGGRPVAFVFGPEDGAVSEKLVFEAAREARMKGYAHLYVTGFAIEPSARDLIERCEEVAGVPATYVQATPDLLMGDLLKTMRSSQVWSVCGLPEIEVVRVAGKKKGEEEMFQVHLIGLDVFDPITMTSEMPKSGMDVPAWFLDADWNGLCFHVTQAFFPRTGAWESLKRHLKGDFEDSVWEHLAGDLSAPFPPGEQRKIAVKVIDDRGNELMVVRDLPGVK